VTCTFEKRVTCTFVFLVQLSTDFEEVVGDSKGPTRSPTQVAGTSTKGGKEKVILTHNLPGIPVHTYNIIYIIICIIILIII
jgi:hypothetical protein